jgi:serine phosphatase RsbU (regulator of sigma subunit)
MLRRLTIVGLIFCTFLLKAQEPTKFDNLMDSANKYEFVDWNLSYSYAKMALENKDADFSYKDIISLNTIFDTYYQKRNMFDSAFSVNKQSLKLATDNKDTMLIAYSLNNMAGVYDLAGNYTSAIGIYKSALVILKKLKDVKQVANTEYNMAIPYSKLHMEDSARYFTDLAFANYKQIGNYSGIASCYDFYATEADKRGNYEEAIKLYKLEIENFEKANEPTSLIIPYQNIADTYLKQKDYRNCKKYLDFAMGLSVEMGSKTDVYDISGTYGKYYEAIGDYKQANFYMRRYYEGKDTMITNQLKTELSDQKSQFDRENSEALLTIQKLEAERNLKSKEEIKWGLILSSVFFVIVLILSVNRYRVKQKSYVKLNEYKNQLVIQKERIEETQKEITDSIHYAKRIQESLLAHKNFIDSYIRDSFILFKPKDIVSGDFYWATKKDNYFYLAVCDSTGHGVPGAFISLLNIGFLSEAINEKNICEPNLVFDYVRGRLIDTVGKDGQSDGFDGILLRMDTETKEIVYTAANSNSVLVSGTKITELQKDKMPVGRYEKTTPFNLYTLEYNSFDTLYLYTDGFADQFGGPKGKKLKYKALNEALVGVSHLPVSEQQQLLDDYFAGWKGTLEQVDDVCVIGIRI